MIKRLYYIVKQRYLPLGTSVAAAAAAVEATKSAPAATKYRENFLFYFIYFSRWQNTYKFIMIVVHFDDCVSV